MDHIAIMKKEWGLLEKILSGEKKIESRWYLKKCAPWDNIVARDAVYFKNSGEPITIKAQVEKVLQFSNLTPSKIKSIFKDYGEDDGIEKSEIEKYYQRFKDKKYCILIFLKNVEKIAPFEIDKSGFGSMSAWISVENIEGIKKLSFRT